MNPPTLIDYDLSLLVIIAFSSTMTRRTFDTGIMARRHKELERMGLIYRVKKTPQMIVWGLTAKGRAAVLQQATPHKVWPYQWAEFERVKARFAELDLEAK